MKVSINKFVILALALISGVALSGNLARASDLMPADDKAEGLTVDKEVQEIEGYSFDDYNHQKQLETQALNKDIHSLQKKITLAEAKKEQAKKKVIATQAVYEKTKIQKKESEKTLSNLTTESSQLDSQIQALKKKVTELESQRQLALQDAKKSRDLLKQETKDKYSLLRRQRQAEKQIEKAQRARKDLDRKRVKVAADNYKLHAKVAGLESQAKRLEQVNKEATLKLSQKNGQKNNKLRLAKNNNATKVM